METTGNIVKSVFPECLYEIKQATLAFDQLLATKQYTTIGKLFKQNYKNLLF